MSQVPIRTRLSAEAITRCCNLVFGSPMERERRRSKAWTRFGNHAFYSSASCVFLFEDRGGLSLPCRSRKRPGDKEE